ncbi:hypothetical protein DBV08_26480 [Rhodococcus sp. KBW08]|nr:hypothetical protein DBV08_26480 [Rhodococcus sp. KBW08]
MDGMRRISNRDFAVDVNRCLTAGASTRYTTTHIADSYHPDRKQTDRKHADRKHGGIVITEVEG